MKKYVFLTLFVIFGTSILSNYITYKSTNSENEIIDDFNPQNIVENVDNTNQNITLDEESEIENVDNIQEQEEIIEKTPVIQSSSEEKQTTISTPQSTVADEQIIAKENEQSTENINNYNTLPQTEDETIQVETSKQEVVKEETVIMGEEYKTNEAMINTIKGVINSNQSENMKLYGYNIVVDNSIVEITSQFTYTEQRVIDKIKYKFGTIRIYVRDYYNNGQYICTQCYLI